MDIIAPLSWYEPEDEDLSVDIEKKLLDLELEIDMKKIEIEDLLDSLIPKAQEEFASVLSKVDRLQKKIESLEEIMDSIRCDSVDDIDDIDFCEKFFADKVI